MIPLLILVGPTASGKTDLAIPLAQVLKAEIISADSMQVYRGMDVGTAKPAPRVRQVVPHHLIDICDPWMSYNACLFVKHASERIVEIYDRGRQVLLVGGTALYIKSLIEGIFAGPSADLKLRRELELRPLEELYGELCEVDLKAAAKISPHDMRRIVRSLEVFYSTGIPISEYQSRHTHPVAQYSPCFIGLLWERADLYRRIEQRVEKMMREGLIEETQRLLNLPQSISRQAAQAIGYKETIEALANPLSMPQLVETIQRHTRAFARRQMTWWRRFPVQWLSVTSETTITHLVNQALERWESHLKISGE